jgi:4-hydroxy-tetrahydrodipicolinate reductase
MSDGARIRVAVAGAAGRMGETVCRAVDRAPDTELVARADPALDTTLAQALKAGPDVLVDFTVPASVVANARQALAAGVHVVIGTTGFEIEDLAGHAARGANLFVAPNFAIGAVLMMQFAARAIQHMARAEIIELHHDRKLDAPSGTASRTAQLMREAAAARHARSGSDPPGPAGSGQAVEIPIHSVRLPGLVAHQEVILGDVGQTLTIRHDSIDRESFMPGVLLAVRRVGSLPTSPVVGLEHLLD